MPLKILSLNLCATWTSPRAERLRAVADFVQANGVDVLLVQEGVRSCFVYNTIRELAGELGYHYFAKSSFGWPLVWEFRVGVLSRFKILRTASLDCEVPQTEFVDAIPLPWRARAVAATVDVPGLGIATLISVHLTSSPKTPADRAAQLKMVADWKDGLAPRDVTIYGGDFNNVLDPCPQNPGFGVAPDYIFAEGGARIVQGDLVLQGQVVTDHAGGVLVEVER